MNESVFHALDLGMLGDWEGAKHCLEDLDDPLVPRLLSLIAEQQRREREASQNLAVARHEVGNALSVAQANVEAMIDGVLEPNVDRLVNVREALQTCGMLLTAIRKPQRTQPFSGRTPAKEFDICKLIEAQARLASSIAGSKNVHVSNVSCPSSAVGCTQHGDAERASYAVRHILLGAVRFTPPGGAILIGCIHPSNEILLSVHDVTVASRGEDAGLALFSNLLESFGAHSRMVSEETGSATFFIALPAGICAT